MPHLETAAIGVWVTVGARDEAHDRPGVSHFLEHMAFKGTGRRKSHEIVEEIEGVGGYLNAYTSREQTAYYVRILKEDLDLAVDILADILTNSTLDQGELERERGVIIQEIGQALDSPEDIIFDHLQERAFPGQPMGQSILGTVDSVQSMNRDHLLSHMSTNYGPQTMWLVGAGAIDHSALVKAAGISFGNLEKQPHRPKRKAATFSGGVLLDERDLEQSHVAIGLPGVSAFSDDLYTAQVFSEIFGGGMSSRLFQRVREERGLCYSIYSYNSSYDGSGVFGIYAGTSPEDTPELLNVIFKELEEIADTVEEKEISRAKAQAKASILMGLENPHSRCEWIARHLPRYGRVIPPAELVERIDAIDETTLKKFAEQLLRSGKPAIAAVGPVKRVESFDQFAAKFE